MNWKNLSLRTQLLGGFGLLAAVVLLVATVSALAVQRQAERFSSYVDGDAARLAMARDLMDAANARAIGARNLLLVGDDARAEEHRAVLAAHERVGSGLNRLKKALADGGDAVPADERRALAEIETAESTYGPVATAIVGLAIEGRKEEARRRMTDITRSKMHEALQQRALEAMAGEQALAEVLELICAEVERIAPEVAAAIVAVEADGRQHLLAAPNLPGNVSCGDAMTGWPGCVATPIRNGQGEVIARFLLFPREPHSGATQVFHQRLVEACTHLCALALERERTRQRIRQLAYYDGLTGLPNRSLLRARAEQAIASAERGQQPLALLFIDLDRFKQVNDSLGHPAGDQLLRHVAMLLQRELRASDVVGRLAGDEFVVVLPSCDVDRATVTLERLQAVLAEPVGIAGRSLMASASVGVAMFPADGRDMDTLLSRADAAMYRAKAEGRGRYAFHAMTPQPAATA